MRTKKIVKIVALFALGFFIGQQLAKAQGPSSLLFKIQKEGIQDSYLYGTFHIMPNKDFELKEKVKNAFTSTDVVALELDMDDPTLQSVMMQNAFMKDGVTLKELFSEEELKQLDTELKNAAGVGVDAFAKMKPFFITQLLLGKYIGDKPASFELTFVQMAQAQKKEIWGLETALEQVSIFDSIPYQDQADDIAEMLKQEEMTRATFQKMLDLYKAEDVAGLYNMFTEYYDEDGLEMALLLNDRNHKWIPRIGEMAKDKSVFFGVGAGHLGGEQGVLKLLKEAGYTVTPVLE